MAELLSLIDYQKWLFANRQSLFHGFISVQASLRSSSIVFAECLMQHYRRKKAADIMYKYSDKEDLV